MRRTMLCVLIVAAGLVSLAPAASARMTKSFGAAFQETFGRATPTPCAHFLCGTGTVTGYGSATSILDITSFQPTSGSGVFRGAQGTGVSSFQAAGDTGHSSLSGTISLP